MYLQKQAWGAKVKESCNMYQLGPLDVFSFDLPLEKAYYQVFKLDSVNVD